MEIGSPITLTATLINTGILGGIFYKLGHLVARVDRNTKAIDKLEGSKCPVMAQQSKA